MIKWEKIIDNDGRSIRAITAVGIDLSKNNEYQLLKEKI
jgi:hypothetical protein